MKKVICFVLVSFLGVMLSLGNASKEKELIVVNARGLATFVRFHAYIEESQATPNDLQATMQFLVADYASSLKQLGYRVIGAPYRWDCEELYGKTWYYCDFALVNDDGEYSELIIREVVRDLGRDLKERLKIGLFAEIDHEIYEF